MKKHHLFTTEEPWTHWNWTLPALCGQAVQNAIWIAGVDGYSEFSIVGSNICEKCKRIRLTEQGPRLRWEYAITEGQVALDEAI